MKISIITVNWWASDFLNLMIGSLVKNTKSEGNQIIVIDNSGELPPDLGDEYLKVIKPKENLGHGVGLDTAIQEADGEYIVIMDVDSHILLQDWDEKLIAEFESKNIRLAGATDSGLLKPMRPLFMMFRKADVINNGISFKAIELGGVKFDVGVHAYFRFLTLFGDKSVLKLPYKKTEYKDVVGNEYTLNGERLVYHNWYGTRWYNFEGKVVHSKIDKVERVEFERRKNNLFEQI